VPTIVQPVRDVHLVAECPLGPARSVVSTNAANEAANGLTKRGCSSSTAEPGDSRANLAMSDSVQLVAIGNVSAVGVEDQLDTDIVTVDLAQGLLNIFAHTEPMLAAVGGQ
jgi:hypothetical protein